MSPVDLLVQRAVAAAMRDARASILRLCTELAGLSHLNPVERAQIRALATIAGIVPHSVLHFGRADGEDAKRFAEHLETIARAADDLIEAIGVHAREEFKPKALALRAFRDPVREAIKPAIEAIEEVANT